MTVFVYVNTSKQVSDADHIKIFATPDAAETWLEENDPEGVAFEYEVFELKRPPTAAFSYADDIGTHRHRGRDLRDQGASKRLPVVLSRLHCA